MYKRTYRNSKFSTVIGDKEYSSSIINVTFKYSVKEFNRANKQTYIKLGTSLSDLEFENGLALYEEDIVGVTVDCKQQKPFSWITLPPYFKFDSGKYSISSNVRTVASVTEIRQTLYRDGFVCNGVKYIRWKRSSGSARVGKCLFIDERLYNRFHRWEMCGLKIKKGNWIDLAALESYISLTSSSIIGELRIAPENILVVDDYESIFEDDVISVFDEDGRLCARPEHATIKNSIFDGESLIDISLMGPYQAKGMVLLRNRFFKSCCFNTNIQKWFFDHNITDVTQLNGFTLASSISDIKLITTPSSIKYLKFAPIKQWFENFEDTFGVVKHEKPPHFMDGKMVQTHYQLINSIQLSRDEMNSLLEPTFQFMDAVKEHPEVLRHWIKFRIEDEIEVTPIQSKTDVVYKMMSVNADFCKTKLYHDFKSDFLKSFTKELKCGRILVNGNYSTLCGNPIELLMQAIGTFTGEAIMEKGCIFSRRFPWGTKLLGSRSPHITMSNILLTENHYNGLINTYMNATPEIVYVNSVNENLLQRLAGCDYDSDTILLTDNDILFSAASRHNSLFRVAVSNVAGSKKKRRYSTEDQCDLDIKTSENLIGDIINFSQILNSLIWDAIAHGRTYADIEDLYLDVCILSVASGIEIDKAKKEFLVDTGEELARMRKRHASPGEEKKEVPQFFAHLAKQKGYYNPEKKAYVRHETSMDYLQLCVNSYRARRKGKSNRNTFLPFSAVVDCTNFDYKNVADRQIGEIMRGVARFRKQRDAIFAEANLTMTEKYETASHLHQDYIGSLGRMNFNHDTAVALLQTIEKEENRKFRRLLFFTLFGYPNTSFYDVLLKSKGKIPELQEDHNGEICIFGNRFASKHAKTCKKHLI